MIETQQMTAERFRELYGNGKSLHKQLQGAKNRRAGQAFEELIDHACALYEQLLIACIEKTPEPIRRITGKDHNGRFAAVDLKKAQPDYKGTLFGGRSVCFEAKQTEKDRIQRSAVTPTQLKKLQHHFEMGGLVFVLVSFDFKDFYAIPFLEWFEMKQLHGRQYLLRQELEAYRVEIKSGYLDFLNRLGTCKAPLPSK